MPLKGYLTALIRNSAGFILVYTAVEPHDSFAKQNYLFSSV